MTNRTKVFGTESSKITDGGAAILQQLARVISCEGLVLLDVSLQMNKIVDGRRNQPRTFTAAFEIVYEITEADDGLGDGAKEKGKGLATKPSTIVRELSTDEFLYGTSVQYIHPDTTKD